MLLLEDVVVVVGQNCLSLFYSEGNVYFNSLFMVDGEKKGKVFSFLSLNL